MPYVMVFNDKFVTVYREYKQPRDRRQAELVCGIQDNARIGLVRNVIVAHAHGLF